MNILHRIKPSADSDILRVDDVEALSAIRDPDRPAVIWEREPLNALHSWLGGLPVEKLPSARLIVQAESAHEAITQAFDVADTPACTERDLLINDASVLAEKFANLMQSQYVRLRFDVVTNNACRRFHIDAIKARIVCTYRGTGTQYGWAGKSREPRRIFTVPTGSPILMRGTLWPVVSDRVFLHRSPPIEGTGETRLVYVIDPITDLAEKV